MSKQYVRSNHTTATGTASRAATKTTTTAAATTAKTTSARKGTATMTKTAAATTTRRPAAKAVRPVRKTTRAAAVAAVRASAGAPAGCGFESLEGRSLMSGTGLNAEYFNNSDFTTSAVTRTDAAINFDWQNGQPAGEVEGTTWSARWTGQIEAQKTGTHTFYAVADDGVRVTIDGKTVIDHWVGITGLTGSAGIDMKAGQKYDITVEYHQEDGPGAVQLQWAVGTEAREVVPTSALYTGKEGQPQTPPPVGNTPEAPVENRVLGLTLVNADTNEDIGGIGHNSTIDLGTLPTKNINIRVNTTDDTQSVVFNWDGKRLRTENNAPYAIAGNRGKNYHKFNTQLGTHTLSVTPHTLNRGRGDAGQGMDVTLHFADTSGRVQPPVQTPAPEQPPAPTPPPVVDTPAPQPPPVVTPPPVDSTPTPERPLRGTGQTIVVNPGDDVDAAIARAGRGDNVVLKDGTYEGGIEVEQDGVFVLAENVGKAVIQVNGYGDNFVAAGGADVTVSGIIFRGGGAESQANHMAAVETNDGWLLQDCTIEKTEGVGLGIFGDNVTVRRVVSQDNGRAGIGGSSLKNGLIQDSISRRNNEKGDSNGGGGKFTRVDGLVIERYQSYENVGAGLWFDYENVGIVIRDSEVHNNITRWNGDRLKAGAAGIMIEVSGVTEKGDRSEVFERNGTVLLENNYVHDNDREGIFIFGSANVTIRNNRAENNGLGQVVLRGERKFPFESRDIVVTGNTFKGGDSIVIQGNVDYTESNNIES